jgi:hypothetical protein
MQKAEIASLTEEAISFIAFTPVGLSAITL